MNKAASLTAIPLYVLPHHRLAAKMVLATLARWEAGALLLVLPDGRMLELGCRDAADPVTLTVKDWKFFWRVLTAGDIGAGESYMAGEWECSDLPELCRRFLRDQSVIGSGPTWTLPSRLHHAW